MLNAHLINKRDGDPEAEALERKKYEAKVAAARPATTFRYPGCTEVIDATIEEQGAGALHVGRAQVRGCKSFNTLASLIAQAGDARDPKAARSILDHARRELAVLTVAAEAAAKLYDAADHYLESIETPEEAP
jgi:hypothetical protein